MKRICIGPGVSVVANEQELSIFNDIKQRGRVSEKDIDPEQKSIVKRLADKSMLVRSRINEIVYYTARKGVYPRKN